MTTSEAELVACYFQETCTGESVYKYVIKSYPHGPRPRNETNRVGFAPPGTLEITIRYLFVSLCDLYVDTGQQNN